MKHIDLTLKELEGFEPKALVACGHHGVNKRLWAVTDITTSSVCYEITFNNELVYTFFHIDEAIKGYNDLF